MPLTHVNHPGIETSQGVHFPMMNGYKIVHVFVTVDGLLGKDKSSAGVSYLDRFAANRDVFEYIAGEKYRLNQSTPPKITITLDDVLSVAQRRQTKHFGSISPGNTRLGLEDQRGVLHCVASLPQLPANSSSEGL
jgi:hypothetical protein